MLFSKIWQQCESEGTEERNENSKISLQSDAGEVESFGEK